MKYVLHIGFILLTNPSFSQELIQNTGSKISIQEANEFLNHHNQARRDVGVNPLVWSQKLSAYAQIWADHLAYENGCRMEHRTNRVEDGKLYGENLSVGSSATIFNTLDASKSWYDEIKHYQYTQVTRSNFHETGHYTQMIWKDTKEVGVGVAKCPDGGIIVVANYYPAGNFIGQFPY